MTSRRDQPGIAGDRCFLTGSGAEAEPAIKAAPGEGTRAEGGAEGSEKSAGSVLARMAL